MYKYSWGLLSTFTLVAMLSGCASTNTYREPPVNTPVASVHNHFKRSGVFDWQRSTIKSIDNKTINYGMGFSIDSYQAKVLPGSHSLVIQSEFLRGFGDGPYSSLVELNAKLDPGMNYILNEKIDGVKAKVWLEDTRGNVASNVASAPYQLEPQNTPVFVPIVVH